MLKIALTDKAQSDLTAIHEHYATHLGDRVAGDLVMTLIERLEQLKLFPGAGRPSQAPDVRELIFTSIPYVAPYRVLGHQVQVLRIIHQRCERPEDW